MDELVNLGFTLLGAGLVWVSMLFYRRFIR